jgi:hypothetical protein
MMLEDEYKLVRVSNSPELSSDLNAVQLDTPWSMDVRESLLSALSILSSFRLARHNVGVPWQS